MKNTRNPFRAIKKAEPEVEKEKIKIDAVKKAVISILGMIGKRGDEWATYRVDRSSLPLVYDAYDTEEVGAVNVFPILIKAYGAEYDIVALYTDEAKKVQSAVLDKSKLEFDWTKSRKIEDETEIDAVFSLFHSVIEVYDEVIIDVSHGFRHLPLLMLIDLMIANFNDTGKVQKILFAKQIVEFEEYEFMDLKTYMDLANISFVLNTFDKNYTVASHIESPKYESLFQALNNFSNDIMALNLNNLYTQSSRRLIKQLNKVEEQSIKTSATRLREDLEQRFVLDDKTKRYEVYYRLSQDLFEKNYVLLSLSLLYESSRLFIKSSIKKKQKKEVETIEKFYQEDWYKVGDFFKNLTWKSYDKYKKIPVSKNEYKQLKNAFPSSLKEKISFKGIPNLTREETLLDHISHTRNNLSHANSKGNFADIKESTQALLKKYAEIIL